MTVLVRYYKIESGKNKGFIVAFGCWPERILKHRGWKTPLALRASTTEEDAWLSDCNRLQAIHYGSVDDLLHDEKGFLELPTFQRIETILQETQS
jgi:hypothetical protein